ncbi:hypothetical protein [Halalkalibaculum sp. DA384]|uniref:hypothetical protein n=1 Tax=Halalkalibaculum sp. DA384 TaxID=3373606 RepID=UPI003754738A
MNDIRAGMGKPVVSDVHLVGLEKEIPQRTGLFSTTPDCLIDEVEQTDLIIIPAIHDNPLQGYE